VYGSVGQQATDGNSKYNSLQASLNKRFSHGLTFLLSYTYAHAQDNGSSLENSSFGTRGTNPLVPGLNWGNSSFDGRQRLVASYTYELPIPHVLNSAILKRAIGGWKVTGNTTLQTGFPINLSDSNFTSLTCWAFSFYGCPDNPNVVAPIVKMDPRVPHLVSAGNGVPTCSGNGNVRNTGVLRSGNFYFAPASVCVAPYGTFGNAGRDSFSGPGINVTNLALMKELPINEKMRFELRLETYNTFNHVNFNAPNSNVSSSQFGRVTSDSNIGPRLVQLGGKFYF